MTTLTRVLRHMVGVHTKRVFRWTDPGNRIEANDRWKGIWTDEAKMQIALDAVEWQHGSTVPTPSEVIAAKPTREKFEAEYAANEPKRLIEESLRNDPKLIAETALQARKEDKTIDKIIEETLAKI